MTGNQTGNQTGGLNLVPLRVIEEETQEEILGVSNREQLWDLIAENTDVKQSRAVLSSITSNWHINKSG